MPLAVLFLTIATTVALPTGIHEAANAGYVTGGKASHFGSDTHHAAYYLMSWHKWITCSTPFVPRGVDVAVADTAVDDLYQNVVRTRLSAVEGKRLKRKCCASGRVPTSW